MILMTIIARLCDGLLLSGTVEKDETIARRMQDYQSQAKSLLKKLDNHSPRRSSIETPPYIFHLIIENNICYMTLCESYFSRRLAFSFLEDIQAEFIIQYGSMVASMNRPYPFIQFERYIEKAKATHVNSRAWRNFNTLNCELHDVTKIMVQNIDDVLQRGLTLSDLNSKASHLSMVSQKYKKDTHRLNLKSRNALIISSLIIALVFALYFYFL